MSKPSKQEREAIAAHCAEIAKLPGAEERLWAAINAPKGNKSK